MAAPKAARPIRNLAPVVVNLRLGSRKDPYYITLRPRGHSGDVHYVPADLVEHPAFLNSVGKLFEVITKAEAAKIEYADERLSHPIYDGIKVSISRQADSEMVVGRIQLDDKGRQIREERVQGVPRRGQEVKTDEVAISRARVPGSQERPGPDTPQPKFLGITERIKN